MDTPNGDDARTRFALLGELAAEAAHELRSALQIVSSSAFVARREVDRGDAAAARPHVAKIEQHARIAHAIVDDVMALVRGERLATQDVPVATLLAAARAGMSHDAAVWDDRIEPPNLAIRAHLNLLARALHVLYENASRTSAPRAPTIVTHVRAEGERILLDVADDGPGVPASVRSTVFDPLVTTRKDGTGLGLALARRIADAHGGAIALLSDVDRKGARFQIELPRDG